MGRPERLSSAELTSLQQERGAAHMHTGAVLRLTGPCPSLDTVIGHLERRLAGLPRYRQRLVAGPLGPRWIEDPDFDLRFHVRHAALPSPAGDAELASFVAQLAGG